MADEVRDRTILVKINSQLHSWSDLGICYLFSEIVIVEEVKYLPAESGFNSQVRFQTIHDCDWAYQYYNGRNLHHGCCNLEIHRANDAISWNVQKIAEIRNAYGISDTPVTMTNDDCLLGKMLRNGEVLNQVEESAQVRIKEEPNVVKERSYLVAHHVLDEMSEPKEFHKLEFSDELRTFATTWIVPVEDEVQTQEQYSTEASNMLDVLVPLRKVCRRPEADYRLQQMYFLNESASVTQSAATDTTTAVATLRMVDYIGVLNLVLGIDLFGSVACIKVFCFDPGGEDMLSVARLTNEEHKNLKVFELVARLIKGIIETYQICNPDFKYAEELNPKRFLTSPADGVLNDWHMAKEYYAEIFEFDHEGEALVFLCEIAWNHAAAPFSFSYCAQLLWKTHFQLMVVDDIFTECYGTALVADVVCPVDNDLGGLNSTSLLHNYTSCLAIYGVYFMILEDKDRFNRGVLLQELGVRFRFIDPVEPV